MVLCLCRTRICPVACVVVLPEAVTIHVARPKAALVEDHVPVKKLFDWVRVTLSVIVVFEVLV